MVISSKKNDSLYYNNYSVAGSTSLRVGAYRIPPPFMLEFKLA